MNLNNVQKISLAGEPFLAERRISRDPWNLHR